MRTTADRIRHSAFFELFGVVTCAPLAAWILNRELAHVGVLSIVLSLLAMCVNYIYNLLFDLVLSRIGRQVSDRPIWLRVLHSILFESSLIIITVPIVAWWLNMNLWHAFLADLGFVLYFLVYAFVYNWIYDVIFPMPDLSNTN